MSWALWGTGGFTSYKDANSDTGGNAYPDAPASSYTITGLAPGEYAVFVRARYEDYVNGPFEKSAKVVVAGSAQQPEEATPTPEPTQEPTPEPTQEPTPEPAETPTPEQGAITGLTLTSSQPGRLWISWDESDPTPTEYRLNWAQVDDPFPSWDSRDGGNLWLPRTAQDFSGLVDAGVTYKLQVRAIYKTGPNAPWSGPWSEVVTKRVRDNPPGAPTGLSVDSATHDGVALSWSAPAHNGLTGYRILRGSSAGALETIVDDTGDLATSHTDTTVSEDTTYHYAVTALSLDGDGAQSSTVSATTPPPPQTPDTPVVEGAPAAPASLTGSLDGAGGVTLSWTDPDDDAVTGYRVLRGGDALSMRVIKEDTGSSAVSYTDASPGADRTYVYAVQARNAAGLSQLSNTASVTVPPATQTNEPRSVLPPLTFDEPLVSLRSTHDDGTVSLSATQPQVDVALTATLTDPDGGVTGTTWQWSSSDSATGTFAPITGATAASYTPLSGDVGNYLKATASYTDTDGPNKSAEQVSDNAVANDQAGTVTLYVTQPEMGIPLTATLADADGEITGTTWQWSSSDTAGGTFTDIIGAASATYRPAEADLAMYLKATATYADAGGAGKSASGIAASAVNIVVRAFVDNTGHLATGMAAMGTPGIATRFKTGEHPEGYKLSEITIALRDNYSPSSVSIHIYSAPGHGVPDSSLFLMVSPASIRGNTTFTGPVGARLQHDTSYHVAIVSSDLNVSCDVASANQYSSGSASDWSTSSSYRLNSDGTYSGEFSVDSLGCAMSIKGKAALDTSYVTDLEITNTPAEPAGYATGETLEATATMSEAVTVDTGTPPTLSVVVGSNTRTMTYNATDSTSTELRFDYPVAAGDKDEDGVSFSADSLTGTVTRTSDSKAADLEHNAVPSDPEAIVNAPPEVTVSFEEASYSVAEGSSSDVTVMLSADPKRTVTIPITDIAQGGAVTGDYTLGATSVTVNSGDTSATVSFSATQDTDEDHGESVKLGFGTGLPEGVTASGTTTTTVTIIDDDPAVTVEFDATTYSFAEGETATVTVTLSEDPKRPIFIPIAVTPQGGADVHDHAARDNFGVMFNAGDPSEVVNLSLQQDTEADDGESLLLSFGTLPPGVSAGSDAETTVTIIDDDPAVTVEFDSTTYSVTEGDSVDVTVTLSADPQRPLTIPVTATGQGGGTSADFSVPDSVTFASGDTSKTISFTATEDPIDDDDEKVKLAFGTYPPGVSAGATSSTKVSINDDDDPEVKVSFGSATYSITEPGSVTVKLTLNADPERDVEIPLSAEYGDDATSADFSGVASSVTFDSGVTSKTFSISTGDDFIDRNGRSVTLSFPDSLPPRVMKGAVAETVISIKDSDVRGVNVFPTTLTIAEDGTGTYTVYLLTEPTSAVTFTINDPTDNTEASAEPASITFDASNFSSPKTVTVTVDDDDLDEASETSTVTHTITGGDYGAKGVTAANVVVTITDDDETPVITGSATPNFAEIEYDAVAADVDLEIGTYSATDGDGDAITWSLSGTDASFFEFAEESDGDLVLSFDGDAFVDKEGPDFENPDDDGSNNTYVVTVEASDGTNSTTRDVTVTVTNVNETPEITAGEASPSFNEIAYDIAASTSVDLVVESYTARDEEGQTITWSLGGDDRGDLTISSSGELAFRNRPDYEMPADNDTDNVYDIVVKATDSGSNTREMVVAVTVAGINERPDIDETTVPDYMEIEYDFTGTPPIIHTFTATDYDDGDTFTWIVLTESEALTIGRTTGVMTFHQGSVAAADRPIPNFENPVDFGSDNVFDPAIVRATDSGGLVSRYFFTVTVTNVNEKPEILGTPATSISQDENKLASEILADYDARDEEGLVTWSLTGADRGDFSIDSDGVVTFNSSPNFEDAQDSGQDNVYDFSVVATDVMNGSIRRSASVDVTATVNDLEEDGAISVNNVNPAWAMS